MLRRTLVLAGVEEPEAAALVAPLQRANPGCRLTMSEHDGLLRLELEGPDADLDRLVTTLASRLGDHLAGIDIDGLAEVVLAMLGKQGATMATAESCTGGLVSTWLTEVPGASEAFLGGVVTYSNQAKEQLVAVPAAMLEQHGAVSEPVARAMAVGVRRCFASDWGIAITGVAGPSGGTATKPVGLVYWAVAGPTGVWAEHTVFPGDRGQIRRRSANAALDLLRRRLLAAAQGMRS